MHRSRGLVCVALILAMLAFTEAPAVSHDIAASHGIGTRHVTAADAGFAGVHLKGATPPRYAPTPGPTFNNPLGGGPARYRVLNVVQDAIRHAYKHSIIRIMSWNIMSRSVVNLLLSAQRRGTRVLAIMDSSNRDLIPNPSYARLHRGLIAGNKAMKLSPKHQSHAKVCINSCRGTNGQAHAKYFLFSHTGTAKKVLMEGSTNLTAAAALNQWNDVFVFRSFHLYNIAKHVFDQAWLDKPVKKQFVDKQIKKVQLMFFPENGPNYHGDPRIQLLDKVRCTGARKAGFNGRTIIRVAPDVMRNRRGMAVAQRLRYLWQHGCNVRVGYTVLGVDIHRLLTNRSGPRGAVPLRHLVQDANGDGEFDNYFHLKAMTINGVVGKDHSAHYLVNGSANISGFAAASDENVAIIQRTVATLRYQNYINYWLDHFPPSVPVHVNARQLSHVDPYAHVDMD